jgi:hypothetical protein
MYCTYLQLEPSPSAPQGVPTELNLSAGLSRDCTHVSHLPCQARAICDINEIPSKKKQSPSLPACQFYRFLPPVAPPLVNYR